MNDLRWKAPEEPKPWRDVFEAKSFAPLCAQKCHEPCGDISEDCLYLNVFTPTSTLTQGRKTGVGVWFHGGAFAWGGGSSPLYDGRYVAPEMDMVIVTVNYRLSAFGFLSLDKREEGQPTASGFEICGWIFWPREFLVQFQFLENRFSR